MNDKLFASIVAAIENATDETGHKLNMSSIMVSQKGNVFSHYFKEENNANDIRSISKPILCMALGIAMERGLQLRGQKITPDTLIWPFFQGKIKLRNTANQARLEKVRLRHLLTHTIGYDVGLLFRKEVQGRDPETLLDYLFNYDIVHNPGEFFIYSNAGAYMISALIQEELGVNLSEWVNQLLFEPLEITRYAWKNYGKYCAAATGLKISHADLHKIGRLIIENGCYCKQQLVPASWLERMRTPYVRTSSVYDETEPFPKYAYGYFLWICKNENYFCYGTDGQYIIILPKSNTVITTLGDQSDMRPIAECFRALL